MAAQKILTQRNRLKQPQRVSEGVTTASYGVIPLNPVFIAIGCNTQIIDNSAPNTAEQRVSGNVDRKRKDKISTNATMTLRLQMTSLDNALLIWVLTKPQDPTNVVDTPDESKAFIDSYRDIEGVEIFRQFLGCKPTGWTFTEDRAGYLNLEITCSCKQILESSTGPATGSGSFANDNDIVPYNHRDAGALPFLYNDVGFSANNFVSSGTIPQAPQDALGTVDNLYQVPTQRVITGSVSIFKKNEELQEQAKDVDFNNIAAYTFDSTLALSISLTGFLWLPSNEEFSGDDAAATMENKSYEANTIAFVDA